MKRFRVTLSAGALNDLDEVFEYVSEQAGLMTARRFVSRLRAFCLKLDRFPQRGSARHDVLPGLRTLGFRRQATICFVIDGDRVVIIRIVTRGRDIDAILARRVQRPLES